MKQKLLVILLTLGAGIVFLLFGAQMVAAQDTDGDGVPDFRDNCPTTANPEKIAFVSQRDGNSEIYVMNPDGTNQTRLTNHPFLDVEPAFSPDGTKIVFSSFRDGNREIYVMNADGTNQTRLTNNPAFDGEPAFSPDGMKIVFRSDRDGNMEVYSMNADGTNQVNLTNNAANDNNPAFSPDGTKIAFSTSRDGNFEIYLMNPDGSSPTRLTFAPNSDLSAEFSRDGSKIVFRSFRDGNSEIYIMNANGTGQTRLTNNPAFDTEPSFSPDGSQIAFETNRDGNAEVYVMNADGTIPTNISNMMAVDAQPSWGAQADSDNDGVGDACQPVALCRNVTVTLAAGQMTAPADVNDGSFDPNGDMLTFMYSSPGPYPAGQTVVTLTVDDGNGGTDSCMGTVTVLYQFEFTNFSDLLSSPQFFNQVTAGSNVPVKFSLNGFQGDPYSMPPTSQQISCSTLAPIGAATTINRFMPDPFYSPVFDFYQTTWQTLVAWKFTCRRLTLHFKDGTTQTLNFYFK